MTMENEMTSIPELRFPDFEGEWKTVKLINFSTLQRGFDLTKTTRTEGEYPVYSSSGIAYYHNEYKLKGPGVITGRKGVVGNVFYVEGPFWPHDTTLWVNDFHGNYPNFVYWFLVTFKLEKHEASTSVPTLNRNNIHGIKISIPTLPEQQKIASFLSAINQKIEQLHRKKELLEQYKKGVLQKIFCREIRFQDENGKDYPNWQERKFSKILHEHGLRSTKKEEVYSVSVHKGLVNQIEHLGRSFAAATTDHYNLVKPHDLVYTKSPTGEFPYGIIKQSFADKDVIVSPLYGVFTPETPWLGYLLNVYFESVANTHNYLHSIIQKGAKNTINITNKNFLSKSLYLPVSYEEQKKIGEFLRTLDRKISFAKKEIAQTRTFKKGLLQQLFV